MFISKIREIEFLDEAVTSSKTKLKNSALRLSCSPLHLLPLFFSWNAMYGNTLNQEIFPWIRWVKIFLQDFLPKKVKIAYCLDQWYQLRVMYVYVDLTLFSSENKKVSITCFCLFMIFGWYVTIYGKMYLLVRRWFRNAGLRFWIFSGRVGNF